MQQGRENGIHGTAGTGDQAQQVDSSREAGVLPHDAQGVAAQFHDGGALAQVVARQGDVGGLQGHMRAVLAHGDADIGDGQGRGVVARSDWASLTRLMIRPTVVSRPTKSARMASAPEVTMVPA